MGNLHAEVASAGLPGPIHIAAHEQTSCCDRQEAAAAVCTACCAKQFNATFQPDNECVFVR